MRFLATTILIGLAIGHKAFSADYLTLTYYQDDTLKLELDLFLPDVESEDKTPLMIFVHGGGFKNGDRTSGHNICNFLADNGFASATITYTLYMKGKSFSCDGYTPEKIKAMQFAANHLWLATYYLIENAEKYNIDASRIFISGSSAGAETVLQAAFWDFDVMNMYENKLPSGFKYSGIVSGAGAIMDLNLISNDSKMPVLMFHGNSDNLVPYATAAHHYCKTNASGWLMLFGSYSIFNHLIGLNESVQLYTYCGGGHGHAGKHFSDDQPIILDFLNNVLAGEKTQLHTIIQEGESDDRYATFPFCD